MTNEKAEKILFYHRSTGNLSPMLNEALDLAISALSKQSASGKQANESVIVNFVAFQRKWLKAHKIMELNSADEVMTEIFLKETGKAFINSLSQSVENAEDGTTDDHIADSDKIIKLEKRTITERLIIAESLINSVIADSDQFREVTKKTDDVPDTNVGKIPYKKPEIIKYERHYDHTDCIWYRYLGEEEPNKCPSTCSQYRDGWNDAMDYIFCNGKGYQPYKRKA